MAKLSKELLPGWAFLIIIALISKYLSGTFELGGKHPLEAALIAIIIGIALRNLSLVPTRTEAGVAAFEKLLVLGIVLVGAGLNFQTFLSQGLTLLLIIVATMITGLFSIYLLGRLFQCSQHLSILLTVGTVICGGTAIAVTAPLIKAKEEETSYAIGTIALFGLIAIPLYPFLANLLHASDMAFGVFAGTAIHSTPQVVGAAFVFSEAAGKTATAVKLVRNCFLAPVAFFCAFKFGEGNTQDGSFRKAFPWFLFGYFVMAGLNTLGLFPPELVSFFVRTGKFFILVGMVGVGLSTRLSAFRSVGITPFFVGLLGSAIVGLTSMTLIWIFLMK